MRPLATAAARAVRRACTASRCLQQRRQQRHSTVRWSVAAAGGSVSAGCGLCACACLHAPERGVDLDHALASAEDLSGATGIPSLPNLQHTFIMVGVAVGIVVRRDQRGSGVFDGALHGSGGVGHAQRHEACTKHQAPGRMGACVHGHGQAPAMAMASSMVMEAAAGGDYHRHAGSSVASASARCAVLTAEEEGDAPSGIGAAHTGAIHELVHCQVPNGDACDRAARGADRDCNGGRGWRQWWS